MSDGGFPNDFTGILLGDTSDEAFARYTGEIIRDFCAHAEAGRGDEWRQKHFREEYQTSSPAQMLASLIYKRFRGLSLEVWECESCGRLHVQQDRRSNLLRGYAPEPGTPEVPHVLGPVEDEGAT